MTDEARLENAARMRMLLYGQLISRALCVAVRLGVPGILAERRRTAEDVARTVSAHPVAMRRLLRALTAFEVFTQDDAGRYALTPLGGALCPDEPGSAEPTALLVGHEVGATWTELAHTIRTGESAFVKVHGSSLFDYLEGQPDTREAFDRSQATGLSLELDEVFDAVDFSGFPLVVDVGGGDGALLTRLLRSTPGSTGVLVDLPGTVPLADKRIAEEGVEDRCTAVTGDFFDELPPGGDLYLLSHVLHDWDDDRASAILRTVRAAMPPGSRLKVIDLVTDADGAADSAAVRMPALMDLYMLSLFGASGGKERTKDEFAALLTGAGLRCEEIKVLPSGMAVITASDSAHNESGR
ncbi:acetylserotonin O-methyltransferase [Streptomyces yerevanensis]|uniref:acetylserotonin O-methyltransferase n=1 Tax=Streptomyces yerevanensis TaxID=66378 RepID=UPI000A8FA560|nr:acetylserotonin O-methyltransferase [Streptomyces yerevanensis]